jgi:Flp pilus assembly protein TadG
MRQGFPLTSCFTRELSVPHGQETIMSDPVGKGQARPQRRRSFQKFRRSENGAAAVEFAIVAAPFFALVVAILELCIYFFATRYLEDATLNASRLILTGQSQASANAETSFKNGLAASLPTWLDPTKAKYDVKVYTDFGSINNAPPMAGGNLDPTKLGFNAGKPGDIVVVRVYYEYPMVGKYFGTGMGTLANGNQLITATTTFRNEPGS